jgi:hypothetical protein
MRTLTPILALVSSILFPPRLALAQATPGDYSIAKCGPNHRVWAKVTWQTNASGRITARTNSYTELASGLNYLNPTNGQWTESREVIEGFPGGAVARHGQHQVIFANDLATAGAIEMQTPDGKRLTSHVLGLSYFDAATGTNVLIAEVTNCLGEILPPNQVIYNHAFDALDASVRYTYTRAGLEQDIILLEVPAPPAAYGLNPATTRLVVMTEFLNPPQPAVESATSTDSAGTPLQDDTLDFGVMQVVRGTGFLLGPGPTGARLIVFKQWAKLAGRQFLLEQVRGPDLFQAINSLPGKHGASLKSTRDVIRFTASTRQLPSPKPGKADTRTMQLASGRLPQEGYVLDYRTVIRTNNFTFQSDSTYYVSGSTLVGTTTIEGGAVIKYTNGYTTTLSVGTLSCLTGPYRMAICTSKDDDSVGETISGSTHSPTNWNGATCLSLGGGMRGGSGTIKYLRFSYATTGASISGSTTVGSGPQIWHCQFTQCRTALGVGTGMFGGPYFSIYNTLFAACGVAIDCTAPFLNVGGQPTCYNLTADGGAFNDNTQDTITIYNSILTACTNVGGLSPANTVISSSATGCYQSVGGASYYLVDGSTNRDAGSTNIDLSLLADLKQKTTYPPIVLTNNITEDTILSPQAQRDTDLPDLGYHYDPLDYAVSDLTITNNLLLTNGVALATYGASPAITLSGPGQLLSQGLANNLNHIVRYNTVQEQSTTNWATTNVSDSVTFGSQSASAQCAFTAWSIPGGSGNHVNQANDATGSWFAHNQFTGGAFTMNPGLVALTNCLWERVAVTLDDQADNDAWYLYNNLLRGGSFSYSIQGTSSVAVAYDNLFDCTSIGAFGSSNNFTSGHNGYVTNCVTLSGSQGGDVTLTNIPVYQTSYLGSYYYPTNGGLLRGLINTGSRSGSNAGLYHFTTQTNQVQETNSVVDIGFHYVAINPGTGQPYDTDGDGIPDYLEDTNGDGTYESSADLSDWTRADTDGDGVSDYLEWVQGRNPKVSGAAADSNGAINLRVYTPLK